MCKTLMEPKKIGDADTKNIVLEEYTHQPNT